MTSSLSSSPVNPGDLFIDRYGAGDPMTRNIDANLKLVNATASRVRYFASHYADALMGQDRAESSSSLRWARPTAEDSGTRGRKPMVLSDGTRVSRTILGCSVAQWERMRTEGIARTAEYRDDVAPGTAIGGEHFSVTGLAFANEMLALADRLSNLASLASRTNHRRAMKAATMKSIGLLSRLACDKRTREAWAQVKLPNPSAYLDTIDGAERATRERRGHHQDVTITKTYRNRTADPSVRYGGRAAEAYAASVARLTIALADHEDSVTTDGPEAED